MFESSSVSLFSEVDIFEDGCQPGTGYSSNYPLDIRADTLEEFLEKLGEHCLWRKPLQGDYELNACEEPGRIDMAVMTTPDHYPATPSQLNEWKQGLRELRYSVFTVRVKKVMRETVELEEVK